jgi:hypothetical protein
LARLAVFRLAKLYPTVMANRLSAIIAPDRVAIAQAGTTLTTFCSDANLFIRSAGNAIYWFSHGEPPRADVEDWDLVFLLKM